MIILKGEILGRENRQYKERSQRKYLILERWLMLRIPIRSRKYWKTLKMYWFWLQRITKIK